MERRSFLAAGSAAAALAAAPRAFAQSPAAWQQSQRYSDPAIQIVDPIYALYVNTQGAPGG